MSTRPIDTRFQAKGHAGDFKGTYGEWMEKLALEGWEGPGAPPTFVTEPLVPVTSLRYATGLKVFAVPESDEPSFTPPMAIMLQEASALTASLAPPLMK